MGIQGNMSGMYQQNMSGMNMNYSQNEPALSRSMMGSKNNESHFQGLGSGLLGGN